jgi:hypothetical protein
MRPLAKRVARERGDWTAKEVSKKKKKMENAPAEAKPARGARRDGTRSREGHGNVARTVTRAQRHGTCTWEGYGEGARAAGEEHSDTERRRATARHKATRQRRHVLSLPNVIAVDASSRSVVGLRWALEGEGHIHWQEG